MQFIYPEWKRHAPYRVLTRDNDMVYDKGVMWHKPRNVPVDVAFSGVVPDCAKDNQKLVDHLFIYEGGGVNLCGTCMVVRDISPAGIRLRREVHYVYSSVAQAAEVLCFGIGLLKHTIPFMNGFSYILKGESAPLIDSAKKTVLLTHFFPTEIKNPQPWHRERGVLESTNIILADTYGELEQLSRRREDTSFLEKYLKEIRTVSGADRRDDYCPAHIRDEVRARRWLEHISLGQWKSAPESIEELLERVDYILDNILTEKNPPTITWIVNSNHHKGVFLKTRSIT